MPRKKAVVLNPKDNVATALADLESGTTIEIKVRDKTLVIKLTDSVSFGHKFSLSQIELGSPIIKYGEVIGLATSPIQPGDHVHIHNVVSKRGRGDLVEGAK